VTDLASEKVVICIEVDYSLCDMKVTYTRLVGTHTNGVHRNNNNTLIFIGLNKTTQITRTPQGEGGARKDKELCSQTNAFECEG
jgi:hypothetical protein